MSRTHIYAAAVSMTLAIAFVACSEPATTGTTSSIKPGAASLDRAGYDQAGTHRQYGTPVHVGNGTVRTYVVLDEKQHGRPLEVGVAMSEKSLEGLPAPMAMPAANDGKGHDHGSMNMNMYLLDLPAQNPTQYKFVQFDWNPLGHEPAGVYDLPHFDFHFWTASKEVRESVVPSNPNYATQAANIPAPEFRAPFYVDGATAGGVTPAEATVPLMGLHWLDVRSPELQGLIGNPAGFKPWPWSCSPTSRTTRARSTRSFPCPRRSATARPASTRARIASAGTRSRRSTASPSRS